MNLNAIRPKVLLGKDESLPGGTMDKLFNPSDFDNAYQGMKRTIEERLNWDLINPMAWRAIGFAGGPIKDFLNRYKETAIKWNESYNIGSDGKWKSHFIAKYGYAQDIIDLYFDVFWVLVKSNKIEDSIYEPWNYTPTDETTLDKYVKTALKYAAIGGVGYLVILSTPTIIRGFLKK